MVGRRGEALLVPPYILSNFKKALALGGSNAALSVRVAVRQEGRVQPLDWH